MSERYLKVSKQTETIDGEVWVKLPVSVEKGPNGHYWVPVGDVIEPDLTAAIGPLKEMIESCEMGTYDMMELARLILAAALGADDE